MAITNVLRYTFILHFLVCMAFAVWFFISVENWVAVVAWPFLDPVAGRVIAGLLFGLGIGSLLAYRATDPEQVRLLVIADLISLFFMLIGSIWMMFVYATIPIMGWVLIGIYAIFFILFLYGYYYL